MEHITSLRRMFDEELPLLAYDYFDRPLYESYLGGNYPELKSHFILNITRNASGELQLESHSERPFNHQGLSSAKKKYRSILMDPQYTYLCRFLSDYFEDKEINFDYLFLRPRTTSNDPESITRYTQELYVSLPYREVGEETLCFYYYFLRASTLRKSFIDYVHQVVLDDTKSEQRRAYLIGKIHAIIVNYLGDLENMISRNHNACESYFIEVNKSPSDVYKTVYTLLEDVILDIERVVDEDSLNSSLVMTRRQRSRFLKGYRAKALKLTEEIKLQRLPQAIETAVLKPLQDILEGTIGEVSLYTRDYLGHFITAALKLLSRVKGQNHDEVYKILIALDYNDIMLRKGMEAELATEMERYRGHLRQKKYLLRRLHQIRKIAVTIPETYDQEEFELKKYLCEHIAIMITALDRQIEVDRELEGPLNSKAKPSGSELCLDIDERQEIGLTQDQFACLVRVLVDTGVIRVGRKGKKGIFEMIAATCLDKHKSAISGNVFKNMFYSPEAHAIKETEQLFVRMTRRLHEADAHQARVKKLQKR